MTTYKDEKKAKLRFIGLYAVSLVLIFLVVIFLWKKTPAATQGTIQQASETESYFIQTDTLLHTKLDELDGLYTTYLRNLEKGNTETPGFTEARVSLSTTIDSIAQQASMLSSGAKKQAMELIVARFKNSLEIRNKLIDELTYLPKNTALIKVQMQPLSDSGAKAEIENLKAMLMEKELRIATLQQVQQVSASSTANEIQLQKEVAEKNNLISSLQTQLKQKDEALQRASVVTNPGATGGEWRQKYSSLKASYDRVVSSEKSLRSAYKTVADDNRRLIGQLQSMKKS